MASGVQRFLSVTAGTGLLILGISGAQAKAASVLLTGGDTSPQSTTTTFNRPNANGNSPPTALSGLTVAFTVQQFSVDTTGNYDFLSVASGWNNYTFLYQSFNQSNPLNNVIIGNDDFPSRGQSGFSGVPLTAGTQYFFVTTGNNPNDRGTFTSQISGPPNSNISGGPVPLPTPVPFEFSPTLGLSILGAWFGLSQLKTRIGKDKTIQGSQKQAL